MRRFQIQIPDMEVRKNFNYIGAQGDALGE